MHNRLIFPDTQTGAGNSGFVFALDALQAAQAAAFGSTSNRVGLSATASNVTGGFETFFVAITATTQPPVTPVPEPASLALFGASLLGLWGARRAGRGATPKT